MQIFLRHRRRCIFLSISSAIRESSQTNRRFHREQEYFFVVLMSFKNSLAYTQRRIDIILRNIKHFCRTFIDDIIIFSNILEKHLDHLSKIFQFSLNNDIKLNSCKTFLNFSSIALLEQHVDDFELHAAKNKIAVILNWKFSATLKVLEIYLEFIEWLRDYVVWYAQKTKSLQQRKIMLLKEASQKKSFRKTYFVKIMLKNSTERELKSFELIQVVFKNSQFLIYFDIIRQFFIDVDAFKENFEAFVYHIKQRRNDMTKSTTIELIVFLSKIFTFVEKRYWSTKLKMTAVVWVIKKLHHMIRASRHFTIIWTDHSATTVIVKQTKLITFNTDKLNLRLIRIVMYLSQFELDVRYKSERDHVISDALFRLSSFDNSTEKISNTLKNVNAYVEIMIEMSSSFKNRLIEEYKTDKQRSSLYEMLNNSQKNSTIEQSAHSEIEFERKNDLVYHLNRTTSKVCLCISKSLMQDIFKMTHDDQTHVEFHRAHVSITKTLYIRRLTHYLR
jgi:hypothetical protein